MCQSASKLALLPERNSGLVVASGYGCSCICTFAGGCLLALLLRVRQFLLFGQGDGDALGFVHFVFGFASLVVSQARASRNQAANDDVFFQAAQLVARLPMMAASVSTRVVSWKEAAEMNESVESDALVMPSKMLL